MQTIKKFFKKNRNFYPLPCLQVEVFICKLSNTNLRTALQMKLRLRKNYIIYTWNYYNKKNAIIGKKQGGTPRFTTLPIWEQTSRTSARKARSNFTYGKKISQAYEKQCYTLRTSVGNSYIKHFSRESHSALSQENKGYLNRQYRNK